MIIERQVEVEVYSEDFTTDQKCQLVEEILSEALELGPEHLLEMLPLKAMKVLLSPILKELQKEIDYLECRAKDPVAAKWMTKAKEIVENIT